MKKILFILLALSLCSCSSQGNIDSVPIISQDVIEVSEEEKTTNYNDFEFEGNIFTLADFLPNIDKIYRLEFNNLDYDENQCHNIELYAVYEDESKIKIFDFINNNYEIMIDTRFGDIDDDVFYFMTINSLRYELFAEDDYRNNGIWHDLTDTHLLSIDLNNLSLGIKIYPKFDKQLYIDNYNKCASYGSVRSSSIFVDDNIIYYSGNVDNEKFLKKYNLETDTPDTLFKLNCSDYYIDKKNKKIIYTNYGLHYSYCDLDGNHTKEADLEWQSSAQLSNVYFKGYYVFENARIDKTKMNSTNTDYLGYSTIVAIDYEKGDLINILIDLPVDDYYLFPIGNYVLSFSEAINKSDIGYTGSSIYVAR